MFTCAFASAVFAEMPKTRTSKRKATLASEQVVADESTSTPAVRITNEIALEPVGEPTGMTVTISAEELARLRARDTAVEKPKEYMNMFHGHFAGATQYPIPMLVIFVKEELSKVMSWSEVQMQENHASLTAAIPDMSRTL